LFPFELRPITALPFCRGRVPDIRIALFKIHDGIVLDPGNSRRPERIADAHDNLGTNIQRSSEVLFGVQF
jgi:hypothetical protein